MQLQQLLESAGRYGREKCFNGYRFENMMGIYFPVKLTDGLISDDLYFIHFRSEEYAIAEKNAELLRKSIVDENLPIQEKLVVHPNWVVSYGGRMANVITLGRIRYLPALPELNEVALHDLDEGMQYEALDAISVFGRKAQRYEEGIAKHMLELPVNWVQFQAAKTLGNIGSVNSFNVLRELYEYISGIMRNNERIFYMTGDESYFRKMADVRDGARRTLQAMKQIDPIRGGEILKYALQDESNGVRHEAKIVKSEILV